jgi:hypothetical protein
VKRVLCPGGALAIWTYGGTEPATKPEVAEVLQRYGKEIVGPFFAPELQRAWDGYSSLPFPFQEIQAPPFSIHVEWDVNQILGYLATWSATQRYVEQNDSDPTQKNANLFNDTIDGIDLVNFSVLQCKEMHQFKHEIPRFYKKADGKSVLFENQKMDTGITMGIYANCKSLGASWKGKSYTAEPS